MAPRWNAPTPSCSAPRRILLDTPGIARTAAFSGFSGATRTNSTNAGAIFSALKPFEERVKSGDSLPRILAEAQKRLADIKEAQIIVLPPPAVRGIGTLGGFAFEVEDTAGQGSAALQAAAGELIAAANQDPALSRVFTFFRSSSPQIYADIDRTKAEMLGVESADVLNTLQVYMGSAYVNDFNLFGRTFRVTAQADAPYRLEPEDIAMLRTRSKTGAMVPLGSLTTFRTVAGPEYVTRYNLRPAAELNGNTAPGASSGQAIAAMERLAREKLPRGYDFEWTGLYFQQILAGNTALYIFPLCVLFVFLTLAALYESWSLPLVIILIVPMCLLAAIAGVWLRGMDNNILTQIGFVVLVGLACKNAILIVEFAKEREDEGMSRIEAAIEACRLRLRPILMTSFAFIFGVVPLIIASGAGAEMRQALGTAVFFGMIGVTLFGLLLTPVFYVSVRWLVATSPRRGPAHDSGRSRLWPPQSHREDPMRRDSCQRIKSTSFRRRARQRHAGSGLLPFPLQGGMGIGIFLTPFFIKGHSTAVRLPVLEGPEELALGHRWSALGRHQGRVHGEAFQPAADALDGQHRLAQLRREPVLHQHRAQRVPRLVHASGLEAPPRLFILGWGRAFHARDPLPDHRPARRRRAVGSGSASRTAFAAIRSAVPKPSVNRS